MNRRSGLRRQPHTLILSASLLSGVVFLNGCAAAVSKAAEEKVPATTVTTSSGSAAAPVAKRATIPITAEGPADTVRVFYKHLREKRFREAIFLTNLRPAIEGLTDTELKEFALDFEEIAGQVPADVEINGEIITGDLATVTANLPNADGDKHEIQTLKLRRDNGVWVILTVDGEAAKKIKADGKNYLLNLRIETHENEARKMLERVSKAQLAHSLQHGGMFTDLSTLIGAGLLPEDIKTSESTGYVYAVDLAADKKQYFATATPAAYGKSGRLSFILQLDGKGISRVTSKDTGGKPMRK
jgi:hypothetical protein